MLGITSVAGRDQVCPVSAKIQVVEQYPVPSTKKELCLVGY